MTYSEFVSKWNPLGKNLHQVVWDLHSWIEDQEFLDQEPNTDTLGSIRYKIELLLDICRQDLPDYKYLQEMLQDVNNIKL